MSLLVTGSIGIDSVQTPFGSVQGVLGGSASYFSYAASFFSPVRLVGAVGPDFPNEFLEFLKSRNIDTEGLEVKDFALVPRILRNIDEWLPPPEMFGIEKPG